MRGFIIRLMSVFFFASFSSLLIWQYITYSNAGLRGPRNTHELANSVAAASSAQSIKPQLAHRKKIVRRIVVKVAKGRAKGNPVLSKQRNVKQISNIKKAAASNPNNAKPVPANTKDSIFIDKLLANYSSNWTKQESNFQMYRSLLGSSCNAISNATVNQDNSPVGTKFTYDGDNKRTREVTSTLFNLFPKENPFKKAPYDSCAVVGNGGILANSSCGKQIDSATYVIRCNLPPLQGHEKDTGKKTNLVTANPSIFYEQYQALNERRRSFAKDMQLYGNALILLPAFSFQRNTDVSLRVIYALEDFSDSGPQPVFFNPIYLKSLDEFWHGRGILSRRLSTGIMMASLALELCNNVHLYGFWPFGTHPFSNTQLSNHYYNNRPVNRRMHAMPSEFEALLNLHNNGVIHLHLGECTN
ncbi:alpha-2,8-sialyltransferase 8F-like isoform 2-T2 [Clarias gariepinus]|uniref:alpha-2,8-sialyltransferase 8F-like isoform X2 n=1 Tax=Clarias gariepinus TaxID=13013 RepID=UPI00234C92C3|nr:alpha-2,8-sialyltransferase 8F-like isoform X2 [Clarias gariepinus]